MKQPIEILYCDPSWRFNVRNRETGLLKSPDRHYQTMTIEEIRAEFLRVDLAKNAMIPMWVYDPLFPEALKVAESCGWKFVTVLFRWLKTTANCKMNFGQGYHTRGGACEEVWLFKRGKGLPVLRHDIRKEFFSPIREHSRKPDCVADWLVALYGDRPRMEMFARTRRPGWQSHGKQTRKFK